MTPERLSRCWPVRRVDGQALCHEVLRSARNVLPVLLGLELVVASNDRLHLELLRVAVEGRVASEQEVRDDTHRPDIDRFAVAS